MSDRAVILDAGNSRLTIARWDGPRQLPARAVGGVAPLARTVDLDLVAELDMPGPAAGPSAGPSAGSSARADFLAKVGDILAREVPRRAVLVTVVPWVADGLSGIRPDLAVVDHTWRLPFGLGVARPHAVGADRLCNVAAAVAAGFVDALIVDAGTATTFDLLQGGTFAGGLIAPGMEFAARMLGQSAARLSPVPFGPCPLQVGDDTASAMAAGAWHVGSGGIRFTIAALVEQYGPVPVVLTGGLGRFLADEGRPWDRFWTLRGAAYLGMLNSTA